MVPDTQALIRLLSDNDPDTVRLVKQQLFSMAEDNPNCLDGLFHADDEQVSRHAHEIVIELERQNATQDFELLCHLGGENFAVEQAAWVLARAIELGGSTLRDFRDAHGMSGAFQTEALVYGREGQDCGRCGGVVRRIVQGQRATYFCAGCQRR